MGIFDKIQPTYIYSIKELTNFPTTHSISPNNPLIHATIIFIFLNNPTKHKLYEDNEINLFDHSSTSPSV